MAEDGIDFEEFVSFLSDPKLEVQQMAAEGVLSMSENQDFLTFCQKHPRKVSKPLLRLVERAESKEAESKTVIETAEREFEDTKGDAHQQTKAIEKAAMATKEAQEAGAAALQALVNLSTIPTVRDDIIALSGVRRALDSLRAGWMEGRAGLAHWYCMLLVNITSTKEGQDTLVGDANLVSFLVAMYVTNPRPPPRDGYDDPLASIGKIFRNVTAAEAGRKALANPSSVQALVKELRDRGRRTDALGALRNLCLDEECHSAVSRSAFAAHVATFVYPFENVNDEQKAQLPEELREGLKASGAAITTDIAVRNMAASSMLGLTQSNVGLDYLRDCGFSEVLRAWEAEESDENTKSVVTQASQPLMKTEIAQMMAGGLMSQLAAEKEKIEKGGYTETKPAVAEESKAAPSPVGNLDDVDGD